MPFVCFKIIWYGRILFELGCVGSSYSSLADNISTIQITTNSVVHEGTKHIEVDCHYVCEAYNDHTIILPCIMDIQIANIFTKALTRIQHEFFRQIVVGGLPIII